MKINNLESWLLNVRTLVDDDFNKGPERHTACDLKKYFLDIGILSETRLTGECQVNEPPCEYTIFS